MYILLSITYVCTMRYVGTYRYNKINELVQKISDNVAYIGILAITLRYFH